MITVNKNLSHDGVDYKKGQVIADEDVAAKLLKMGHADAQEAPAPAKVVKPKAAKGEAPADVVPPVDESFDDIEDNAPPAAEVPKDEKPKAAKKAKK